MQILHISPTTQILGITLWWIGYAGLRTNAAAAYGPPVQADAARTSPLTTPWLLLRRQPALQCGLNKPHLMRGS